MPHLDRAQLIELLRRLDGPDEKDIAAAARAIAGHVKEAGVSWDDLLAPAGHGRDAEADPDPLQGGEALLDAEETAEAVAAIEALLARDEISATTRDDLKELRADIDRGMFGKSDLRYVRALRARLS